MTPQEEHERLSRELGKEVDELSRKTEQVEDKIKSVRADWRAKQHDDSVPGAIVPAEDEESAESEGDQEREPPAEHEGDQDREPRGRSDAPDDDQAGDDEDVSGDRPDRRSST
jgi:hypothetical protein